MSEERDEMTGQVEKAAVHEGVAASAEVAATGLVEAGGAAEEAAGERAVAQDAAGLEAEAAPVDEDAAPADPNPAEAGAAPADPAPAPAGKAPEPRKATGLGDLIIVGILSIIVGILFCLPTFLAPEKAESDGHDLAGGVAATVGDTAIGENDVTTFVQNFRTSQGLADDAAWGQWLADSGMDAGVLRSDVLNSLVGRELIKQACAKEGVEVEESAVDEQVNLFKEQMGEEQFAQALEDQAMTIEDLRGNIRSDLMRQKLVEKVVPDAPKATDEEVLDILKMYYADQVDESVKSLDEVDPSLVAMVRNMLDAGAADQAYSNWMADFAETVTIQLNEMPKDLPYDVDVKPYLESAQDTADALIDIEPADESDGLEDADAASDGSDDDGDAEEVEASKAVQSAGSAR